MKNNIKTLLDSVAFDNEKFIKESDQTVSEYLLENAEETDQGWLFYLSDKEIEEFENNEEKANSHIEEIKKFVNENYNYKIETLFLVDTLNNNKVVGEFDSQEEVNEFLNNKESTENWENEAETFEEWKENFFTVTSGEMQEAIREKGSRVKEYWT
jgi:hypothetical protein